MLSFIEGRPELIIEIILAVILIIFAVYLGGPWYLAGPTTVIGNTIEAGAVRAFTAVVYIVPGAITLFGLKSDKARAYGTFGLFLAYLFTTILRLLTFGPAPLLWLFTLGLALVAAVVYVVEARRIE